MLETARGWLTELRAGGDPRRFVDPSDDPADGSRSAAEDRALLLLALQYDHQPGDAALLRLLLDAEIEAHRHADFQGLEEELRLAAWLVAGLRDPADVFRMWRAKHANFDTGCGLDGEHLAAAGVARTVEYLRTNDDPRAADILADLAERDLDEEAIAGWHAALADWFPASEADESPLTLLERALRFAPEQAPHRLELWLASEEPGDRTLADLCQYSLQLGDYERAIAAARQRIDITGDGDLVVGLHEQLGATLIAAGRLDDAEAALMRAATLAAARVRSAWQQRCSLEKWLDLAEAAAPREAARPLARRAFARADHLLTAGFGHCFTNLDRLTTCARVLGEEAANRLAGLRDAERRRIDRIEAD